jgi:peptide/nickel transport system ATP-binding protein
VSALLELKNLKTHFQTHFGTVKALEDVSFTIDKGKVLGVVGESGCGKSVTAQSILRIIPANGDIVSGEINYTKEDDSVVNLATLPYRGKEIQSIRGNDIAMIFQEPMSSFSPVYTIGNQICEAILLHQDLDEAGAREIAVDTLTKVGMPNPGEVIDYYPFSLSGGMRQRAMIAMALSCDPNLLIADEPTTALDVTIQAQILELLRRLQAEFGMSIMIITHDMGVISDLSDRVVVMYLGRIVEEADVEDLFFDPIHPYTKLLLESIPRIEQPRAKVLRSITGSVPDAYNIPPGCSFYPRCPIFEEGLCNREVPDLIEVKPGHLARCFKAGEGITA